MGTINSSRILRKTLRMHPRMLLSGILLATTIIFSPSPASAMDKNFIETRVLRKRVELGIGTYWNRFSRNCRIPFKGRILQGESAGPGISMDFSWGDILVADVGGARKRYKADFKFTKDVPIHQTMMFYGLRLNVPYPMVVHIAAGYRSFRWKFSFPDSITAETLSKLKENRYYVELWKNAMLVNHVQTIALRIIYARSRYRNLTNPDVVSFETQRSDWGVGVRLNTEPIKNIFIAVEADLIQTINIHAVAGVRFGIKKFQNNLM